MAALKDRFRPEFLNRIDEFVTFNALGVEQLKPIVDLEIVKVSKRLSDRGITLQLTDAAKEWIAETGYDPVYGARPLKRAIQREIETPLSKLILSGTLKSSECALIDVNRSEGSLTIQPVANATPSDPADSDSDSADLDNLTLQ